MKVRRLIIIILVAIVALFVIFNCFSSVGTTERGILVTFGRAGEEVLNLVFTLPFHLHRQSESIHWLL